LLILNEFEKLPWTERATMKDSGQRFSLSTMTIGLAHGPCGNSFARLKVSNDKDDGFYR
jgi:hypothetical protein